jgi:hypothetical protein
VTIHGTELMKFKCYNISLPSAIVCILISVFNHMLKNFVRTLRHCSSPATFHVLISCSVSTTAEERIFTVGAAEVQLSLGFCNVAWQ